jgi:hypothetical protein
MIIWGGMDEARNRLADGARYDPSLDTWAELPTQGAPVGRFNHSALWAGEEMIIWGGSDNTTALRSGGRYDPLTDRWEAIEPGEGTSARSGLCAVWNGHVAVYWSGNPGLAIPEHADILDVSKDTWFLASTEHAPYTRSRASCTLAGQRLFTWGGSQADQLTQSGAFYLPPIPDRDADDWPLTCDCDDADPLSWSAPSPAQDLLIAADKQTLEWQTPLSPGGQNPVYDVLRSPAGSDFVSDMVCVEQGDGADQRAVDADVPGSGNAFYYLVRSVGGCPGDAGAVASGSGGLSRETGACLP